MVEAQLKGLRMPSRCWKLSSADSLETNRNSVLKSKEINSANDKCDLGERSWTADELSTRFHLDLAQAENPNTPFLTSDLQTVN